MIVLDTNVVSELMKLQPDTRVLRWLERQVPDDLYLSAITVTELLAGVGRMPPGRRRDDVELRVRRVLSLFGPVIVPFGDAAAEHCASIIVARPDVDVFDAQIAAIARAHGAGVATRNVRHFADTGVTLIDPWAV